MTDVLADKPSSGNHESRTEMRTLLLAQKTELVGELTRAIANQFNNTMMAITSYAELEMKKAPSSQRRSLEQVISGAGRATDLIQQLLAITRKQTASPQAVDLNTALSKINNLVEQLAGERISVVYKLDSASPSIKADPVELEQAVLSLAINARNAMSKGGTLTISTRLEDLTKESAAGNEDIRPGKYVLLSVDDTGYGRPVEEFEFEMTENLDQNSRVSLSLAVVRGIVKSAGGWFRCGSEPGKGSSFKIYFPVVRNSETEARERTSPRSTPVARTILVVEDDDAVRLPAAEFLKMEGFKVLQARTGAEAIHVVQQNRSRLDVLITDIVMPKMTGHEVAEKLVELHPDLKVLYMSGDTDQARRPRITERSANAVLRKPFRLETLKDTIYELLGE